jgi:hypothetical protein
VADRVDAAVARDEYAPVDPALDGAPFEPRIEEL